MKQVRFPFLGISWRAQGRNGLKFVMLMYADHLQNWLNFVRGLLIFLILAPFWLSQTCQIWGFWDFLQNAWEEWAKSGCTDVSWPPLELIIFWLRSVGFPHLGGILTGRICSFLAFSWECKGRMGWNLSFWFILTIFKTDLILAGVCWLFFFTCLLCGALSIWLDFDG